MESPNRVGDGSGNLVMEEAEMRRIWKEYYEDLYGMVAQERVAVHECGFDGEPIGRTEVEVRMRELKSGGAADREKVKGEMILGGGGRVVNWIWRLCNVAF